MSIQTVSRSSLQAMPRVRLDAASSGGLAGGGAGVAAAAVCLAAGMMAASLFLPHEGLWIDEAAQLSGLSLGPVEVVNWLTGRSHHDFGVPDDRMPPLSYWMQWLWSRLFGLEERPLRWFGVMCVGAAVSLVFEAARRAWGLGAGVAAGILLGLSPNVVVQAVDIRAYPLFL